MSQGRKHGPSSEFADDGLWLEPGEAEPGLLVFAEVGPSGFSAQVEAALQAGAVAALVADISDLAGEAPVQALATCRDRCHRHAAALLVRNDIAAARAAGADGVHLDDPARVAAARSQLGSERIVGAACGLSRHTAMVAGEAGADYVMLGTLNGAPEADDELFELVSWWNEMFVIPCAAAGRLTPALAIALVRAGADLVAVPGWAADIAALAAALQHVAGPDDVETQG